MQRPVDEVPDVATLLIGSLAQGKAVDYAIVSPAHMSTFSKAAPFIDAPFIFRDLAHWNGVLDADMLKPVADEIERRARVMLIGYAGGGVRNIFANRPLRTIADALRLTLRPLTLDETRDVIRSMAGPVPEEVVRVVAQLLDEVLHCGEPRVGRMHVRIGRKAFAVSRA